MVFAFELCPLLGVTDCSRPKPLSGHCQHDNIRAIRGVIGVPCYLAVEIVTVGRHFFGQNWCLAPFREKILAAPLCDVAPEKLSIRCLTKPRYSNLLGVVCSWLLPHIFSVVHWILGSFDTLRHALIVSFDDQISYSTPPSKMPLFCSEICPMQFGHNRGLCFARAVTCPRPFLVIHEQ